MQSIESIVDELPFDDDITCPLDDHRARVVIAELERAVNRYRFDLPQYSVELARYVIQIGTLRGETCEIALGTMLLADSLWQSGLADHQTAWDKLGEAAALYRECGDELGWARTRIGRLAICYGLQRVDDALADTPHAESVFLKHHRHDKLLTLRANTAFVYGHIGRYEDALVLLQQALEQAEAMGDQGEGYIAALCRSMGYAHSYLGQLQRAQTYYQRAYEFDRRKGWRSGAAASQISLSYIARARGDYQEAMRLLLNTDFLQDGEETAQLRILFLLTQAELDLELHRYESAHEAARAGAIRAQDIADHYYQAYALMLKGSALVGQRQYAQASEIFTQAEALFESLGSSTWLALAWLQKGLVALKQGQLGQAQEAAAAAAYRFEQDQRRLDLAEARLLQVEIHLHCGEVDAALTGALQVIDLADKMNIPTLRYEAQYLLGRVAEAQGRPAQAIRYYRAACETIWQLQRSLTITLRPDFMVDKNDAAHALIRVLLDQGEAEQAFETIEQMKAQIVLNAFANRAALRWQVRDTRTQAMIAELDQLRAEHQYAYRLLYPSPVERGADDKLTGEQRSRLMSENHTREQKMQRLTEQLYLEAASVDQQLIDPPGLAQIRSRIPVGAAMIAYYGDGQALWGFTITPDDFQVQRLPIAINGYTTLLNCLHDKLEFALDLRDDPDLLSQLTIDTQHVLHDLYRAILQPLSENLVEGQPLWLVPYGPLHYLPFSALHDGQHYLIEKHDLVILPAASLITRDRPEHSGDISARVIAHSWQGHLASVPQEAHIVHQLCGGDLHQEEAATASALNGPPRAILHICAHGEFRIDRPEISFIQLQDRQLYTDDLLQHDMQYRLVVLSSCETGRADIAPGDELIGLGRGFLYAGAGAVLATLWRIESDHTLDLMRSFYERLLHGDSSSQALRRAQLDLLTQHASQHPVFWAPFQLTGGSEVFSQAPVAEPSAQPASHI